MQIGRSFAERVVPFLDARLVPPFAASALKMTTGSLVRVAMKTADRIACDCVSIWNEPDAQRRRRSLESIWLPYLASNVRDKEIAESDAVIGSIRQRFPQCRFYLIGPAVDYRNCVRFSWFFGFKAWGELAQCTDLIERDGDKISFIDGGLFELFRRVHN